MLLVVHDTVSIDIEGLGLVVVTNNTEYMHSSRNDPSVITGLGSLGRPTAGDTFLCCLGVGGLCCILLGICLR